MSNLTSFWIDEQEISLDQILHYLQASGHLKSFMYIVLRQHVITQLIKQSHYSKLTPDVVDHVVNEFRMAYRLQEPEVFNAWLQHQKISLEDLRQTLIQSWVRQQVQTHVSQPRLYEYFIEHKRSLDQIYLSSIEVDQESLAHEIYDQLIEKEASFEQLAHMYSLGNTQIFGGKTSPISRRKLPESLKSAVSSTSPGDIMNPMRVGDRWYIFRLDDMKPAALDGELKQQLQAELFEQEIAKRIQAMTVKLKVPQWLQLKTSTL